MNLQGQLKDAYVRLERYYRGSGIRMKFEHFVALLTILAVLSAIVSYYVVRFLPVPGEQDPGVLMTVTFVSIMSLILAIPFSLRNRRLDSIEDNLPDALKHMSIVLKAGGTIENAMKEASGTDYGPLSESLGKALDQIKKGREFEDVLMDIALESGSRLFERIATIINDAKRAGAGLADTMSAIADDAREINRIRRERVSRTTMPTIFLYASVLALSPFIFGFTMTIVSFIGSGITCALPGAPPLRLSILNSILLVFMTVETVIAAMAIGIIREGKMLKYAVRVPIMILITLAVYEFGKRFGLFIIGGGGACG